MQIPKRITLVSQTAARWSTTFSVRLTARHSASAMAASSSLSIRTHTYTRGGGSPTNWASLRLIGSNCTWRCDTTRLAPSGSLLASNTTATLSGTLANEGTLKLYNSRVTVAGDLSLQTGSTLLVDLGATNATVCSSLTAEGGVTLGGTLQVVLRAVPEIGVHYRILDKTSSGAVSGAFASGTTVSASFGGKPYGMTIKYGSGDGNDVDLVRSQAGTVVLIR